MAMNDDLKECPFCHSECELYTSETIEQDAAYWVRCDHCDIEQRGFYTIAEAVERWNRRL